MRKFAKKLTILSVALTGLLMLLNTDWDKVADDLHQGFEDGCHTGK